VKDSIIDRRQVLTGGIVAALGLLWKPGGALANEVPPGAQGATIVFDVACLGNTMGLSLGAALDAKAGDLRGTSFSVEGNLYPQGTIPAGDGFDPASVAAIGHWFCHGWLILNPARPEPHLVSTVEYVFGRITAAQPSPADQIVTSGLEGAPTVVRTVVGGTGRYRGVKGEMIEQIIGTNSTVVNLLGGHAANFRCYITP
jgi:hypothetical protein